MERAIFIFIFFCAFISVFAVEDECTKSCTKNSVKDCGCSKTSRTVSHTKETLKDHDRQKWTEQQSTHDHGLKYGAMVLLQGGEFFMGTNNPKIVSDGEGPARVVRLNSFYMDQYEVCNHDFNVFVNKTGYVTEVSKIEV